MHLHDLHTNVTQSLALLLKWCLRALSQCTAHNLNITAESCTFIHWTKFEMFPRSFNHRVFEGVVHSACYSCEHLIFDMQFDRSSEQTRNSN